MGDPIEEFLDYDEDKERAACQGFTIDRRKAATVTLAGLFGITARPDRANADNLAAAREAHHRKFVEFEGARRKAFEVLVKLAKFTPSDCEHARKAICKRLPEERDWATKFDTGTVTMFWMNGPNSYDKRPLYWQAIRMSFLLGTDGFVLLEIDDHARKMVGIMDHCNKNRKMVISIPRIDLPPIAFGHWEC